MAVTIVKRFRLKLTAGPMSARDAGFSLEMETPQAWRELGMQRYCFFQPTRRYMERREFPQWGSGWSPGQNRIWRILNVTERI